MDPPSDRLIFYVNGRKVVEEHPKPSITLLKYLRRTLELTGTKNSCSQGGCGSCTVMVSSWDFTAGTLRHCTVNSCITPICSLHGCAVTTIEGLGNRLEGIQPIQESLVRHHGIQCGYCTPGMVMSAYCLTQNNKEATQEDLERTLEGNLCRCTGYRPIVDGFKQFCQGCSKEESCCSTTSMDIEEMSQCARKTKKVVAIDEELFPQELQRAPTTVRFTDGEMTWIRPTSLQEVLDVKQQTPDAVIVMGATALYSKLTSNTGQKSTFICCTHVTEMNSISQSDVSITIGAAVSLSSLETYLQKVLLDKPEYKDGVVGALVESLRWLACDQIKSSARVGGSLMLADVQSDLSPILMTAGATARFVCKGVPRDVLLDSAFFCGTGVTSANQCDILVHFTVPLQHKNTYVSFYKQSTRRGFDSAVVNACFSVTLNIKTTTIESGSLSFGGIGDRTHNTPRAAAQLTTRRLDLETLAELQHNVTEELQSSVSTSLSDYKLALVRGFLRKFWMKISKDTSESNSQHADTEINWTLPIESSQVYEEAPSSQPSHDAVGRPIPLVTADGLVTGEAMFVDDFPRYRHELYLELVGSTRPHAKILNVDVSRALAVPGVVEYIDAKCVPGSNKWGVLIEDEFLFATDEVTCYGQTIGAVLAESEEIAKTAAELIDVTYQDLPTILTVEEAIQQNSFHEDNPTPIQYGNPDKHFSDCDYIIQGQIKSGLQEHFYMETFTALVVPKKESGEIEVFTSIHAPSFCQSTTANLLDVPENRVNVRIKRLGGGFGGKEYRPVLVSGPAAVAANRCGRPVRCTFDRQKDIHITGKRQSMLTKYKCGFNKNGKIQAVSFHMYANGGNTTDLSSSILLFAQFCIDGGYKIPNVYTAGYVCKTNTPSNTSFRGFGAPEAVFVMETVIALVAQKLSMYPEKVRELNMYKEGDETHLCKVLEHCNLGRCWEECKLQSDFDKTRTDVEHFNKINMWKKRGIATMPIKMCIGIAKKLLNQGGALVQVYKGGSVLVAHGGVEMGQGLHTKMIQVASRALGIPMGKIYISETSTSTVANMQSTSASASSDIFGEAVMKACIKLNKRLQPYKDAQPDGTWEDWVLAAFLDRISLSATALGRPGDHDWDFEAAQGDPCNYFTFGAACTVVEIDCLTGDHQVMSTDIVMDVGKSLNPSIDIGQIEGAFVQGYGLMVMEECHYSSDGLLLQKGPRDYKIPCVRNIPRNFRVSLLKDCPNTKAVYSSKGIGEPPLIGSISVYLALREAIMSARHQAGKSLDIQLNIPLTAEKICLACTSD